MGISTVPSILHIEDSEADLDYTRDACDASGCIAEFTVLRDGAAALAHIRLIGAGDAEVPDLILLDLNLPMVPGHQVLEQVRRTPRLASIPVVVLTSTSSVLERDRSLNLGATAHLTKPTGMGETQVVIRRIQGLLPG